MRYALLVSYDGTDFCGWQRQPNGRSVQAVLEGAAEEIFSAPVRIQASGRTDAGVHALGQVCILDGETNIPAHKLRECFNRLLPQDVKVLASCAAPQDFDCTRQAKRKTYCYRAYFAQTAHPLLDRYCARLAFAPDAARIRAGAECVLGEHDFAAFCASGSSIKTTVRTIYSVTVEECERFGARLFTLRVCGNGFLYNMVRILAGELFAIGCGKEAAALCRALQTGERALLAKTMPACGLMLESVEYGISLFAAKEE